MSSLDAATMASLLATFLEESFEGLDRAEGGLLALEHDPSPEVIADLFRAIHSIKGGAGAFGVTEVSDLAHVMENLLDDIRSGLPATAEMVAGLLVGVDALRRALHDHQQGNAIDSAAHAPIITRLAAARSREAPGVPPMPVVAELEGAPWRVAFIPHAGLMRSGNDPLRMLRQLADLGGVVLSADTSRVPSLDDLDPTAIHLGWDIRVPGSVRRVDIEDVFAWVDGDCDLTIAREAVGAQRVHATAAPVETKPSVVEPASTAHPQGATAPASAPAALSTLRVGVDKIDLLMNMVGELVITQSMLGELDDGPIDPERAARLREGLSLLARNTRALQESVVRLRSTPVSSVFARLPRLVHDLAARLGKQVSIEITGQSTELDKTVIEKIGDPLVHIVRNAIDHGLETSADREAAGKSPSGTIRVHAEHRGSAVVIEIADDGRGLDYGRILSVAKERGIVAQDATLRDDEISQLIFAPGFSTAREVSEVSGRGVGMDVVSRAIKELRGEVHVDSEPGRGTRVILSLPLTLAIIDGQLLRLADQTYVIPLLSIVETVQVDAQRRRRFGGGEVFRVRDQVVPIVDLAAALDLRDPTESDSQLVMIVETDSGPLGLVVDELLAQQQVVIKSLEVNYGRVDGLAGATILGDGRVAFILDVVALARQRHHDHSPAFAFS